MGNEQTKQKRRKRQPETAVKSRRRAAVIELNEGESQLSELIKNEEYLLLDFTATWCKPCRAIKPTFEAMAKKYGDSVACVSIDVDKNESLAEQYDAQSIPFFVLVEGHTGKTIGTKKGIGAEQLEAWISEMTPA